MVLEALEKEIGPEPQVEAEPQPYSLGFMMTEMLSNGTIKNTISWKKNELEDEHIRHHFFVMASKFARGEFNEHFAEFAEFFGQAQGQEDIGYVLFEIFDEQSPFKFAMRPDEVFHSRNPTKPPFLFNDD